MDLSHMIVAAFASREFPEACPTDMTLTPHAGDMITPALSLDEYLAVGTPLDVSPRTGGPFRQHAQLLVFWIGAASPLMMRAVAAPADTDKARRTQKDRPRLLGAMDLSAIRRGAGVKLGRA